MLVSGHRRASAAISITLGTSVGTQCTSADGCWQFAKFWANFPVMNNKRMSTLSHRILVEILRLSDSAMCTKVKCLKFEIIYNIKAKLCLKFFCLLLTSLGYLSFTVHKDITFSRTTAEGGKYLCTHLKFQFITWAVMKEFTTNLLTNCDWVCYLDKVMWICIFIDSVFSNEVAGI